MREVELTDWRGLFWPEYVENILRRSMAVLLTGSRFTVDPPVLTTDVDIVILVADKDETFKRLTEQEGWSHNYSPYWGDNRRIVRKDIFNIIIVDKVEAFTPWITGTQIAKGLNLTEKEDRAFVFEVIRRASQIEQELEDVPN